MYIKVIHNMIVDIILRLDYGPIKDDGSNWMTFAQCWCYHNFTKERKASTANITESMNLVFANRNEEASIYPLTTREIVEAQQEDENLKINAGKEGYST